MPAVYFQPIIRAAFLLGICGGVTLHRGSNALKIHLEKRDKSCTVDVKVWSHPGREKRLENFSPDTSSSTIVVHFNDLDELGHPDELEIEVTFQCGNDKVVQREWVSWNSHGKTVFLQQPAAEKEMQLDQSRNDDDAQSLCRNCPGFDLHLKEKELQRLKRTKLPVKISRSKGNGQTAYLTAKSARKDVCILSDKQTVNARKNVAHLDVIAVGRRQTDLQLQLILASCCVPVSETVSIKDESAEDLLRYAVTARDPKEMEEMEREERRREARETATGFKKIVKAALIRKEMKHYESRGSVEVTDAEDLLGPLLAENGEYKESRIGDVSVSMTAFVVQTLCWAHDVIEIDDKFWMPALEWLKTQYPNIIEEWTRRDLNLTQENKIWNLQLDIILAMEMCGDKPSAKREILDTFLTNLTDRLDKMHPLALCKLEYILTLNVDTKGFENLYDDLQRVREAAYDPRSFQGYHFLGYLSKSSPLSNASLEAMVYALLSYMHQGCDSSISCDDLSDILRNHSESEISLITDTAMSQAILAHLLWQQTMLNKKIIDFTSGSVTYQIILKPSGEIHSQAEPGSKDFVIDWDKDSKTPTDLVDSGDLDCPNVRVRVVSPQTQCQINNPGEANSRRHGRQKRQTSSADIVCVDIFASSPHVKYTIDIPAPMELPKWNHQVQSLKSTIVEEIDWNHTTRQVSFQLRDTAASGNKTKGISLKVKVPSTNEEYIPPIISGKHLRRDKKCSKPYHYGQNVQPQPSMPVLCITQTKDCQCTADGCFKMGEYDESEPVTYTYGLTLERKIDDNMHTEFHFRVDEVVNGHASHEVKVNDTLQFISKTTCRHVNNLTEGEKYYIAGLSSPLVFKLDKDKNYFYYVLDEYARVWYQNQGLPFFLSQRQFRLQSGSLDISANSCNTLHVPSLFLLSLWLLT